jgi:hypothetical protein
MPNHLIDAVSTEKPWREMTLEEKRDYRAREKARVEATVKEYIEKIGSLDARHYLCEQGNRDPRRGRAALACEEGRP